jgi:hypothetical protein
MVFATFICGIVFIGCKDEGKNEVVDPQRNVVNDEILIPSTAKVFDEKSARLSYLEGMEDYEEFAKMLAISLKDKNMRKFLKDEANKKFDGDYDILVAKIQDNLISGAKFGEHLKKNEKKANSYVEVLKNEKLNISIPLLIEKWVINSQIPLVAIAINAEEDTKLVKAFDSNGKVYLIDNIKEPNLPVIVVGLNERIDIKKTISNQTMNSKSNSLRIQNVQCVNPYRVNGKYERWKGARFSTAGLQACEVWTKGAPELRLDLYSPVYQTGWTSLQNIGNITDSYEPTNRNDIKDKWWYGNGSTLIDQTMYYWDISTISKTVKYYWWEFDGDGLLIGTKTVVISDSFKIPSVNGSPEVNSTITTSRSYPNNADEITSFLVDQQACPPYFEGSPTVYGVYGGTNFKWATLSN